MTWVTVVSSALAVGVPLLGVIRELALLWRREPDDIDYWESVVTQAITDKEEGDGMRELVSVEAMVMS
ncbi:hypothetical protein D5S18_25990 [Nocardia panacis]|uniref:Uncharacterized protein n=1 Tax=Nocardia panacis TaxID=2340916 RepID=A0A3A4KCW2_9NOCA|nr:hypothetical protein [Nocardia panacis]RJO70665.1 hypothetical protein D5S18_25990 [Nocardia panacis]